MSSNGALASDQYRKNQEEERQKHIIKDPNTKPENPQKEPNKTQKNPNKSKQITNNPNQGSSDKNPNPNPNPNTNSNPNANPKTNIKSIPQQANNSDFIYYDGKIYRKQKVGTIDANGHTRTVDSFISKNRYSNSSSNQDDYLIPDNGYTDTEEDDTNQDGVPLTTLLPIIIVGLVCAAFLIVRRKRKNSHSFAPGYDSETDVSTLNNDSATELLSSLPSTKETVADTENTYVNNKLNYNMNGNINSMPRTADYYDLANENIQNIPSVIIPNVSISNPNGTISNVNLINGKIPSVIHPNVSLTNGNICNTSIPNVTLNNGGGNVSNVVIPQGYNIVSCNGNLSISNGTPNGIAVVPQCNSFINTSQNLINKSYIVNPNTPPFNTKPIMMNPLIGNGNISMSVNESQLNLTREIKEPEIVKDEKEIEMIENLDRCKEYSPRNTTSVDYIKPIETPKSTNRNTKNSLDYREENSKNSFGIISSLASNSHFIPESDIFTENWELRSLTDTKSQYTEYDTESKFTYHAPTEIIYDMSDNKVPESPAKKNNNSNGKETMAQNVQNNPPPVKKNKGKEPMKDGESEIMSYISY